MDLTGELEVSERTLEETLRFFERGQRLANFCVKLLDEAELKVQIITKDAEQIFEDKTTDA
ncbi:MAG: exodeoxyribonuclease VII small subunit [Anaerolinea sp. 4484_236]|nr:MAG: exodeoxyribonuclease VII small subunit [Anaerolinea sp. 4484_236]